MSENALGGKFCLFSPYAPTIGLLISDKMAGIPILSFLTRCHRYSADELDFDNVVLDDEVRPSKNNHVPKCHRFSDKTHRTVALIAGSADEHNYEEYRASVCRDFPMDAILVPFPSSELSPQEASACGIDAIGAFKEYLIFADTEELWSYLCPAEKHVLLELGISLRRHDLPRCEIPFDLQRLAAERMVDVIRECESGADRLAGKFMAILYKIHPEMDDAQSDKLMQDKRDDHFMQGCAQSLAPFLALRRHEGELNDAYAERVRRLAVDVGSGLAAQERESRRNQLTRIQKWVIENSGEVCFATLGDVDYTSWIAWRIPHPKAEERDIAVFHATVPLQQNWPQPYTAPPVIPVLPELPTSKSTDLDILRTHFLENAKHVVRLSVDLNPDPTTPIAECRAVKALNNVARGSIASRMFDWMLAFDQPDGKDMVNVLENYPAIEATPPNATSPGAIAKLSTVPFGKAFVHGPRSTLPAYLTHIIRGVLDSPSSKLSTKDLSALPYVEEEDAETFLDDWEDATLRESDGPSTLPTMPPSPLQALSLLSIEQREKKSGEPGLSGKFTPSRGNMIVWTVPKEELVDPVRVRLTKQFPGKLIVRSYLYGKELNNVLSPKSHQPEDVSLGSTSPAVKAHLKSYNASRQKKYREQNPALDGHSASQIVKQRMEADPARYPILKQALEDQEDSPSEWEANRFEYLNAGRVALADVYRDADILLCTNVALSTIFDHLPVDFEPDCIIIDDAASISEANALIPMSLFPDTFCIFAGDVDRSPARSPMLSDPNYVGFFTQQQRTSIMERSHQRDAILVSLGDD